MTETRTDPNMAKIPKTLQFQEDVARLIQFYADKKGTNFQKVVQAAVLQFFFSDIHGPDEDWMTAFIELEKGTGDPPLDLSRLPMKVYEAQARRLERKLAAILHRYAAKEPKSDEHAKERKGHVRFFENAIMVAHSEAGLWRSGIDLFGGGLDGVIEQASASAPEYEARMDLLEPPDLDDDE